MWRLDVEAGRGDWMWRLAGFIIQLLLFWYSACFTHFYPWLTLVDTWVSNPKLGFQVSPHPWQYTPILLFKNWTKCFKRYMEQGWGMLAIWCQTTGLMFWFPKIPDDVLYTEMSLIVLWTSNTDLDLCVTKKWQFFRLPTEMNWGSVFWHGPQIAL